MGVTERDPLRRTLGQRPHRGAAQSTTRRSSTAVVRPGRGTLSAIPRDAPLRATVRVRRGPDPSRKIPGSRESPSQPELTGLSGGDRRPREVGGGLLAVARVRPELDRRQDARPVGSPSFVHPPEHSGPPHEDPPWGIPFGNHERALVAPGPSVAVSSRRPRSVNFP